MQKIVLGFGFVLSSCFVIGCSGPSTDDTTESNSPTAAVASAVGSALGGSDNSGTVSMNNPFNKYQYIYSLLIPQALASTACPTVRTAPGAGCATNGGTKAADITYADCSFGSSTATWTGILAVSESSATQVTCGAFVPPAGTDTVLRQFVDGASAPSTAVRTSARGIAVTLDDETANLNNYQADVIAATIGTGYGSDVHFTVGARDGVSVARRIYSAGLFDHSVSGNVDVAESTVNGLKTWTIGSGVNKTVTVYHNLIKVKGTSTFNNVVYNEACCTPVSGNITTLFTATGASGVVGLALSGRSESLTFNGCGSATYVSTNGDTLNVTTTACY